jgi:hypothetical protein
MSQGKTSSGLIAHCINHNQTNMIFILPGQYSRAQRHTDFQIAIVIGKSTHHRLTAVHKLYQLGESRGDVSLNPL